MGSSRITSFCVICNSDGALWPAAECQSQEDKLKLTRFLDLNLLPCLPCSEDQQRDSREMHAPFHNTIAGSLLSNSFETVEL